MVGLDEAEDRITAVRGKFERQLQRLRERERLVEVSRQDCQKEEEALQADRERHREQMEQVGWGAIMAGCSGCRDGRGEVVSESSKVWRKLKTKVDGIRLRQEQVGGGGVGAAEWEDDQCFLLVETVGFFLGGLRAWSRGELSDGSMKKCRVQVGRSWFVVDGN